MTNITDEQWIFYFKNGYLKLGKTLSDDELAGLQQRINDIMLGNAKINYNKLMMQLDSETGKYSDMPEGGNGFKGASLNYRKIQNLEQDPLFLTFMQKPIFREICAEVYGAHASISIFRAMFMNKPAKKGTFLPWHQDAGGSWHLDRDPLVTVWTALDPATIANGCVMIVPGSHRMGLLSDEGHIVSDENIQTYCQPENIVYLELEPGETVLLHNWALHASDINKTDIARRGFSVCYMDARTKNVKKGEGYPVVFGKNAMSAAEIEPVKQS